jgi:hypothetical protein
MTPKQVAREWLYFLGGLLVPQILIIIAQISNSQSDIYSSYFKALFSQVRWSSDLHDKILSWAVTLGPYLLFQLVRSIVWAFRTAFNKTKTKDVNKSPENDPPDLEINPEKYDNFPIVVWRAMVSVGNSVYETDMPFKEWKTKMIERLGIGVDPFVHRIWYNLRPRPTRR